VHDGTSVRRDGVGGRAADEPNIRRTFGKFSEYSRMDNRRIGEYPANIRRSAATSAANTPTKAHANG
jgi:hypothetical protein